MKEKNIIIEISVVLLQEGDYWVTQGLEYDIAAQGKTISEAKKAFERTITGQIFMDIRENRKPLQGIEKAPQEYWDKFERAEPLKETKPFSMPKGIPPSFVINAVARDYRIAA